MCCLYTSYMEYVGLGSNSNKVLLAVLFPNNVSDNSHVISLQRITWHSTQPVMLYMDSGSVHIRNIPTYLPEYTTVPPRRKRLLRFENITK